MTSPVFDRRLAALETRRAAAPLRLTPEEAQVAARRYEASLSELEEPDPRRDTYFASRTLKEISSDYDAMLKGALAPWE